MKRYLSLAVGVLALGACSDTPAPVATSHTAALSTTSAVDIDPALTTAIASASSDDQLEVIVSFDESLTSADAFTSAVLSTGAGVVGFGHLPMVAALATPAQIATFENLAGTRSIFLNSATDRILNREAVTSVQANTVHVAGITGTGVGVAILDTGIDGTHPDLAYGSKTVDNVKVVAQSKDIYTFEGRDTTTGLKTPKPVKKGYELMTRMENSDNNNGHGSHVAATAAGSGAASGGKYAGVAPGANLIGVSASEGGVFTSFAILAGFDYILEHQRKYNIQVVNNSWGSAPARFNPNSPINIATKEVHDAGITVMFAGGNDGPDANTMNPRAVAPWVIAVAAGCKLGTDPTRSTVHCVEGDGRDKILADFSSRGVAGDTMYTPDILAPGVHLVSARASMGFDVSAGALPHDADLTSTCAISDDHLTKYTCLSGTSMATPVATGVVALLEEVSNFKITPDQVLAVLQASATRYPAYGAWEIGAGYINAKAAVELAKQYR